MAWLSNLVVVSVWLAPMFFVFNTGAQNILTTSCAEYVIEGGTVDCTCVGLCQGDDTVTPTWPGHADNSNRLVVPNISRQQDGQQFECRIVCDGQTYTTIYTLQVAYGPGETDTKLVGPSPFLTFNGTQTMTLTCNATVNPTPDYLWAGVSCENGNTDSTCIYTPNITEDGTLVQCVVTNRKFNPPKLVKSDSWSLNLHYPPQDGPEITVSTSGPILKAGDIMTCTVTGGKPLVSTVNFYCDTPDHQDQDDVRNETAVSSSLVIDTSQATEDNMTCYCSASWTPQPDLYTLIVEYTFQTEYPAKVTSYVLNEEHQSLTVTESEQSNVTIQCEARGRPGPGLLLSMTSHDGTVNLTDTDQGSEDITVTSLDYNITMANWTDMGNYTCIAWNGVGVKDSTMVTLNVNSKPRPASEEPEGRDRTTPLNMTESGIQIELRVYPEPYRFIYTRYGSESDETGEVVAPNSFTHNVTNSGPGSNFMTCTVTGRNVPEEHMGVYSVNISNDYGHIEYFFIVEQPFHPKDNNGTAKADIGLIIGVVAVLFLIIVVIVVAVIVCRRRRSRGKKRPKDDQPLTPKTVEQDYTNPGFAPNGADGDNDSGIVMNGRSSPPETSAPRQSDGAGYATVGDFSPAKQPEGVLRKKSARAGAYEVTSIAPTGKVSIKQAAPQPNAYQEPWDTKNNMILTEAPGGPPTPHNVGPKGDEYATVSSAKNKTTITVGPKGDVYSTVAKHGMGGNTQGSPARTEGSEGHGLGQEIKGAEGKAARGEKGSSGLDADGYATAKDFPAPKAASSPPPPAAPLSMNPHPLDTPGYATLAQMAPGQGNQGDVTSSTGNAAARGTPAKDTPSPGEGTDAI